MTADFFTNPYYFTGRRIDLLDDGNLPLQHNRHRYYDYYTGRWTTQDPLGITPNAQSPKAFVVRGQYMEGMNLYQYVGSRPSGFLDGLGLGSSSSASGSGAKYGEDCKGVSRDFHWTHDFWEKDLLFDDHVAKFSLDFSVKCVPAKDGCCFRPQVQSVTHSESAPESMGIPHFRMDVVEAIEFHGFVRCDDCSSIIHMNWVGRTIENPNPGLIPLGEAVGTGVGILCGTVPGLIPGMLAHSVQGELGGDFWLVIGFYCTPNKGLHWHYTVTFDKHNAAEFYWTKSY